MAGSDIVGWMNIKNISVVGSVKDVAVYREWQVSYIVNNTYLHEENC